MGVGAMTPAFYNKAMWRGMGFSSADDLRTSFLEGYFVPMDPNVLLVIADKWQHGDVATGRGGDLDAALGGVRAKVLVMPISTDRMFPPDDCAAEQQLLPGAELRVIESDAGHRGLFAPDATYGEQIDRSLSELLAVPA